MSNAGLLVFTGVWGLDLQKIRKEKNDLNHNL
jgi:hypothetical protein